MILSDRRSHEVRRWAEAEATRLAEQGELDEPGILAAVLERNPWRADGDPWSQETTAAVARRAAMSALARPRRSRPAVALSEPRLPLCLALLFGGIALCRALGIGAAPLSGSAC